MKTAYTVIELLQQRISELELQLNSQNKQYEAEANIATPFGCLLIEDTNTWRILRSDLDDKCSVKTVPRVNMDLLRGWARWIIRDLSIWMYNLL